MMIDIVLTPVRICCRICYSTSPILLKRLKKHQFKIFVDFFLLGLKIMTFTGKTIVHEWAHYRWGVFDETQSDGNSSFYLNSVGKIDALK